MLKGIRLDCESTVTVEDNIAPIIVCIGEQVVDLSLQVIVLEL